MIYFISLICFLLPSYLVRFNVFSVPTTLLEVLIYVAAVITIVKFSISNFQFSNKSKISKSQIPNQLLKSITHSQLLIPILLFLLAGIISIFVAPDKREALGLFKAYVFDPILFFFIVFANVKNKNDVTLIFKALILSGFLVALHAIWQRMTGQLTPDGRVIGLFGFSANYLALYLAPLAVLTFCYQIFTMEDQYDFSNYKRVWYYDVIFLAMILAIWLSGSRAALGAVILGIIAFSVIKYWSWIKARHTIKILLYCSIALLLIVGWQIIKPNWQLASGEGGRITSSNNIRWEIWKTTVKDILPSSTGWRINWLLGVGPGEYQNYFTILTKDRVNFPEWISPMALTPHNLFLTIWVNLGLLGLVAFIWLLIIFFKLTAHHLQSRASRNYCLLLITLMLTLLIQGIADSPYWKNDLAVFFWVILALSFSVNNLMLENEKNV